MKSGKTLTAKLMLSYGAVMTLLVVLAWVSLASLSSINKAQDQLVQSEMKQTELAAAADHGAETLTAAEQGMLLAGYAKDAADYQASKQLFHTTVAEMEKINAGLGSLAETEVERQTVDAMQKTVHAWASKFTEMERLCDAGQVEAAEKIHETSNLALARDLDASSKRMTEIAKAATVTQVQSIDQTETRSRWTAWILLALSLAAGAVVFWIVRGTSGQVRQLAFEMADAAAQVASASGQVSAASQSLAQGASEQAASIEETSASSEELTSVTRKAAENSSTAAQSMAEASRNVDQANQTLQQMIVSMREITNSSDKISKIIKVIDEIAFQTNILALNAAVEAARAGEAGMGFAVVADEVRNLAQRSAQAAKDTASLIEESIAKSQDGRGKLDEVARSIQSITASTDKVRTLVDEISMGSQEQSRGFDQINKAITQMQEVTQKTASNAEESAAASEEMNAQAEALNGLVRRLRLMVDGAASGAGETAPPSRRQQGRLTGAPRTTSRPAPRTVPALATSGIVNHNAFPLDEAFSEF